MFVIPTLDATMLTRRAVRGAGPEDRRTTRPTKRPPAGRRHVP
jgi:hypothetical protein